MTTTATWTATLTATSSIAHGGVTRGTITLLRRELVVQPGGRPVLVPVISGNAFRGRLRRIGEELLREVLGYEGQLALPVAHALRGGGSLAKTSGTPLSGARLHTLRALVPHVGVFGCAGGGRLIDGCLQVGKVVPHLAETAHITGAQHLGAQHPGGERTRLRSFDATQIETYVRADDADAHSFADVLTPAGAVTAGTVDTVGVDEHGLPRLQDLPTGAGPEPAGSKADQVVPGSEQARAEPSQLMVYRVETLPAGTRFATWLRLEQASDLELSYFTDVLATFAAHGRLGGRAATGHGQVRTDLTRTDLAATVLAGSTPSITGAALEAGAQVPEDGPARVDWRAHLRKHRHAALTALEHLS